jgi:Bacterial protein of unknown function (DUF937)
MAIGLVSLVSEFLTPTVVGRIASALGVDRNKLQTAVNAAVPGLLAGLTGVAVQPGGAQKLVDAVGQHTGPLDNIVSSISAGGQTTLIERESRLLTSLLGGHDQSALTDAVSKYTGLNSNVTGSLLGILGPIVMGTVAKQASPLNANGIKSLFASQKDSIAAALPRGLSDLLGGTGLLDSLGSAARTATNAGGQAGRVATSAASAVTNAGQRVSDTTAGSFNWLYWLLPAAAVAALLIYLFTKPAEQVVQQGVTTAQSLTVNGLDVGKQLPDSIASLRAALEGVTDPTTAQAALPKLQDITAQIDRIDGLVDAGAAQVARWDRESAHANGQSAVRQSAGGPGGRGIVEAGDRYPQGEAGHPGRVTFARPTTADANVGGWMRVSMSNGYDR